MSLGSRRCSTTDVSQAANADPTTHGQPIPVESPTAGQRPARDQAGRRCGGLGEKPASPNPGVVSERHDQKLEITCWNTAPIVLGSVA